MYYTEVTITTDTIVIVQYIDFGSLMKLNWLIRALRAKYTTGKMILPGTTSVIFPKAGSRIIEIIIAIVSVFM